MELIFAPETFIDGYDGDVDSDDTGNNDMNGLG